MLAAVKIKPGRNVAAAPQASNNAGTIMITTTTMTRILFATTVRESLGSGTSTSRASPPKLRSRPISAASALAPARDGVLGTTTLVLAGASTDGGSVAGCWGA